jgi:hypothetical protein
MDEAGWSNVTFTPHGQQPVIFKFVTIRFPTVTAPLAEDAVDNLDDFTGPIDIRIQAPRTGDTHIFSVDLTGTPPLTAVEAAEAWQTPPGVLGR